MKRALLALGLGITLALGAAACKKSESPQAGAKALERHSSEGVIKDIRAGGKVLVIDHKEMPGFMEAMTMPFELADPKLGEGLKKGDKVQFTIEGQPNGWPIVEIKKL